MQGNWTLRIHDAGQLLGELKGWSLTFYGTSRSPRNRTTDAEDDGTLVDYNWGAVRNNVTAMSVFLLSVMGGLLYVYYRRRRAKTVAEPSGIVNIL